MCATMTVNPTDPRVFTHHPYPQSWPPLPPPPPPPHPDQHIAPMASPFAEPPDGVVGETFLECGIGAGQAQQGFLDILPRHQEPKSSPVPPPPPPATPFQGQQHRTPVFPHGPLQPVIPVVPLLRMPPHVHFAQPPPSIQLRPLSVKLPQPQPYMQELLPDNTRGCQPPPATCPQQVTGPSPTTFFPPATAPPWQGHARMEFVCCPSRSTMVAEELSGGSLNQSFNNIGHQTTENYPYHVSRLRPGMTVGDFPAANVLHIQPRDSPEEGFSHQPIVPNNPPVTPPVGPPRSPNTSSPVGKFRLNSPTQIRDIPSPPPSQIDPLPQDFGPAGVDDRRLRNARSAPLEIPSPTSTCRPGLMAYSNAATHTNQERGLNTVSSSDDTVQISRPKANSPLTNADSRDKALATAPQAYAMVSPKKQPSQELMWSVQSTIKGASSGRASATLFPNQQMAGQIAMADPTVTVIQNRQVFTEHEVEVAGRHYKEVKELTDQRSLEGELLRSVLVHTRAINQDAILQHTSVMSSGKQVAAVTNTTFPYEDLAQFELDWAANYTTNVTHHMAPFEEAN
jgi:hypothetical protein